MPDAPALAASEIERVFREQHGRAVAVLVRSLGDIDIAEEAVQDAFAEGKEHLGGFTIIRAPDLDAALEWGRKAAVATTLPIEVRPFQDGPGD